MAQKDIVVIRYGHREVRDYRVTGHCGLVSRAFGAKKMVVCGERDESILNTIKGVNETWGGKYKVEFIDSWREAITNLKNEGYVIVHLTMYGLPTQEVEEKISKNKKIAILIGSQKVERPVYEAVDFNVAVTAQPHSEIAALAVFMDRIQKGEELSKEFAGAKCSIIPQEKGKKVVNFSVKNQKK
ncbi:MAG: tRNA (cytidine(56)-2'-O)-methyltransferase [archaeon]|jgi:tRNA (cytidine56-2'-O)-methyltransferase